jgi:hypothetical protein
MSLIGTKGRHVLSIIPCYGGLTAKLQSFLVFQPVETEVEVTYLLRAYLVSTKLALVCCIGMSFCVVKTLLSPNVWLSLHPQQNEATHFLSHEAQPTIATRRHESDVRDHP